VSAVFVLVYCVYFVSIGNILVWICVMWYAIQTRRFTIAYFCVLFVENGVLDVTFDNM
jgi:hypothetical protein